MWNNQHVTIHSHKQYGPVIILLIDWYCDSVIERIEYTIYTAFCFVFSFHWNLLGDARANDSHTICIPETIDDSAQRTPSESNDSSNNDVKHVSRCVLFLFVSILIIFIQYWGRQYINVVNSPKSEIFHISICILVYLIIDLFCFCFSFGSFFLSTDSCDLVNETVKFKPTTNI